MRQTFQKRVFRLYCPDTPVSNKNNDALGGSAVTKHQLRQDSIAMITAWIHDDHRSLIAMTKNATPEHALDAALVAAALVRCWGQSINVPPDQLMQDLAMVCELNKTT